nr:nucleoside-diphosphate kinase [endosymbiont GvMRE of Glomus versiforme]
MEKTLSIIKPDIVKKNQIGEIINFLEKKGLKVVGMKMVHLTIQKAKRFYQEHQNRPFFEGMVKFMCSSPVVVMCLEGENAIKLNREIMGATNPHEAKEGTIRKIYGKNIEANAIHGSDSEEAAEQEINFFLKANYSINKIKN